MSYITQYNNQLKELVTDKTICKENKELYKKFFEYEEYKLKRQNNLPKLDNGCYKTLLSYLARIKNINKWFNNKPLKNLTKADIKKVYDNLEEGKIKTSFGKPFKDRRGYYNKIFKSKLFDMVGKKEIAKQVMEFYKKENNNGVRFVKEETFRKIVSVLNKVEHKLLTWLAFDIGENINSLLLLKKKDFVKQKNPHTKEEEYVINLPQENLKRSRQTRSEITNFSETTELINIVLSKLKDKDLLFPFGYGGAKKFFSRAVKKVNAKCFPNNDFVSWKDLRSGMACFLLSKGWSTDEVNARLGHKPSSREIDKYVNFLAIKRHSPKKKLYDNSIEELKNELEETKRILKLQDNRYDRFKEEVNEFQKIVKIKLKKIK